MFKSQRLLVHRYLCEQGYPPASVDHYVYSLKSCGLPTMPTWLFSARSERRASNSKPQAGRTLTQLPCWNTIWTSCGNSDPTQLTNKCGSSNATSFYMTAARSNSRRPSSSIYLWKKLRLSTRSWQPASSNLKQPKQTAADRRIREKEQVTETLALIANVGSCNLLEGGTHQV